MILYRHILRAHLGPFLFSFLTLMFVFLLQFLIKQLDQLVGKGYMGDIGAHHSQPRLDRRARRSNVRSCRHTDGLWEHGFER